MLKINKANEHFTFFQPHPNFFPAFASAFTAPKGDK